MVAIAESHVGGITVSKGWAFVSGQGSSIRKYRLTELRDAMKPAGTPYLTQVASDPATLNVIPRMHKATISSLTSLVP